MMTCVYSRSAGALATATKIGLGRALRGLAFARTLQRIARAYPDAKIIHLVSDNLNTHSPASLVRFLGPEKGNALAARFAASTVTVSHAQAE